MICIKIKGGETLAKKVRVKGYLRRKPHSRKKIRVKGYTRKK